MTSITSYMFRHRGAILREYIRKKEVLVMNYTLLYLVHFLVKVLFLSNMFVFYLLLVAQLVNFIRILQS
jgi:hypothetical protein